MFLFPYLSSISGRGQQTLRPDRKYFRLCGPDDLCHGYSSLLVKAVEGVSMNKHACVLIKLYKHRLWVRFDQWANLDKLQKVVKDREAWDVAHHGVVKSQTQLSD